MSALAFFAPCPRGLEAALAAELRAIGATVLSEPPGGVRFEGDASIGLAANLHSRIASRVLQQVAHGPYRGEDDLYRLAHQTEWSRWHEPLASLRVDVAASGAPVRSLQFATLRIKDGIVDHLRERHGDRPSIERHRPDRRVYAFLDAQRCTLYLDWSGESLFKRGWRRDGSEAPLKENLAAGLLALSGWTPGMPLVDPFCGSGTIAIEAATIAAGLPPGLHRRFAFERMRGFDRAAWDRMRHVEPRAAPDAPPIHGSDVSEASIAAARANLSRCGVDPRWVALRQLDVLHLDAAPAPAGVLLSNPPYGERLEMKGRQSLAQVDTFWAAFATLLKQRFAGWNACLLTSDLELPGRLRLKPSRRTPLFNGALECRLFRFEMVAGSARRTD
ncbi:MAG TPA: THUMP domain-containing protein [Burkholderiaceae bacterium]|nr:THUMP domain-containing protein [Burkholderiaceae bacterium]